MGNAHLNVVPYQVFPTKDGHIVLAVGNDGQFARFCQLAGDAALAQDARYATNTDRLKNRESLIPVLAGWMLKRTTLQWVALLEPNAVPCAPILKVPEVFEHPQVVARGMQTSLRSEDDRVMPLVANPMRFDGQRAMADQAPPALDQHGEALREALAKGGGWPARGGTGRLG
jgi:crotonobetainyl-CoA:carnitine CoA-transferase CaiB-like acyl-CoA transferase